MTQVDPWRFAGSFLKNALGSGIPETPSHEPIPWAPVIVPISESKLALLSTAGLSMKGDTPFDMDGERARPTWGDPSWRRLARDGLDNHRPHPPTQQPSRESAREFACQGPGAWRRELHAGRGLRVFALCPQAGL